MIGGYTGRILGVNLTKRKLRIETLDEGFAKKYIGGVGFAAKILWDETTASTRPLSPENVLVFMTGPLTGTKAPSSSRYIVAAISPLTGIWGEAHAGGIFGWELKHAGFDGIILKGMAESHIYLWINDGKVEIEGASHLWGKDNYEVAELIRKETDQKASVASIGLSGEKLVKIAGIISDGKDGRAAARCGLGAVMGSKNLKAIAVRGTMELKLGDEEKLRESVKNAVPRLAPKSKEWIKGFRIGHADIGTLPIKNWLKGTFEGFGEKMALTLLKGKQYRCRGCVGGCLESMMTKEGRHICYEAIAPLGSLCLIDDMATLEKAYVMCNKFGLDAISAGTAIAFAMECFEKGLIDKEDTGGISLTWGNSKAMIKVLKMIADGEGIGKLLGQGVRNAAERIGGLAKEYAIHVKGLEPPAHDPRAFSSLAVGYATSPRGACHVQGHTYALERFQTCPDLGYTDIVDRFKDEGKGEMNAKMQNFMSMLDSLISCQFLFSQFSVMPSDFIEWLNYVTGLKMDLKQFMKTGECIFNLKRLFNVRRGMSRKDDTLPSRLLTHKRGEGGAADNLPCLGRQLNEYYSYRGWSEEGIPTKETLTKLGLEEFLDWGV